MIDFHTHLDLYPNARTVAQEASKKNSFTLAVTTSPRAWIATTRVLGSLPNIKIALGLHPEIVAEKASERDLLLQSVAKADFIGETGLDGSPRHRTDFQLQVSILDSLLQECATQGGRIISLHSRRAADQVLDLLDKHPDAGTPVLHWFSGSKKQLERAIDRGCWFSFGPAGLATKSGQKTLEEIPLHRLLPESDGPFAQYKDEPVMPWQAHSIISNICKSRGLEKDLVENQFKTNLSEILKGHSNGYDSLT
tara:strand:- start:15 stop:770 length:756 start_codon:yes stop_codon:yes gene_type:complete